MYKFGAVQKKVLLLLLGGVALSVNLSAMGSYKIFKSLRKDWKKIDNKNLGRTLSRLTNEKLLNEVAQPDGSFKLTLTKQGEKQARLLDLLGRSIHFKEQNTWDKKWRIVLFDIPEDYHAFRDVFREHLRALSFYKLQHSVFLTPYPCEKELAQLIHLYGAEHYVRIITAIRIDNEDRIKIFFFKNTRKSPLPHGS